MPAFASWIRLAKGKSPESMRRLYRRAPLSLRRRVSLQLDEPWRARDRQDMAHLRLLLRLALSADDNCVDIGANRGNVLYEMVHAAPSGCHVAIEPIPDLADDLRSRFPGVDVHAVALADRSSTADFELIEGENSLSSLIVGRDLTEFGDQQRRIIQVDVRRLDDLIPGSYVPRLIKIDVEGRELAVLRGARQTLSRAQPIVVFEHVCSDITESRAIWHLLCRDLSYRLFDIDGNGPLTVDDFLQSLDRRAIWNWVAHP